MFGKDGSEKQCAAIESKLIVYLDGRAAPAERHAVEEHLSGCASCRTRAEEFRALSSVLDDLPEISPSPEFDATLRARIAAEPAPRNFWNWLPSPRLAFAVTALVVMSVWLSSGPRVTTSPSVVSHAMPVDRDEQSYGGIGFRHDPGFARLGEFRRCLEIRCALRASGSGRCDSARAG